MDLYRVAEARLNDIDDVNDAIQETMIIAYKSLKNLKNPKYFKTWMIKILINQCNKIYKHNNKKINIIEKLTKDKRNVLNEDTNLLNIENKMDLEEILKKLNYDEKIVIVLFYECNYSLNEVSNILKTNSNTIKSRLDRTKQKIKKLYKGGVKNETTEK